MGLADCCQVLADRLALLPGVDQATTAPPAMLPDARMVVVTPDPGTSAPAAHGGRSARPVIAYRDRVVVEAHYQIQNDLIAPGIAWALPLLDAVQTAIWSAFAGDQIGGTVATVQGINVDRFGGLGWGQQPTFGFLVTIDLTRMEEVSR